MVAEFASDPRPAWCPLELPVCSVLHESRVVAEFYVAVVPEHGLVGEFDCDRALALRILAKKRFVEQEF